MTVKRAHVRILVRTRKQAGIIKLTTHTHTHTHAPHTQKMRAGERKLYVFWRDFPVEYFVLTESRRIAQIE